MSNEMNANATFAGSLEGWAVMPDAALDALRTWKAAESLRVDSPVDGLRSDAYAGTLNAKNVGKRLADAGQVVAAQAIAPQLIAELDGPLARRFGDAVLADGDRIISELAVTFDTYASRMAEHAPLIPAGLTADQLLATANSSVVEAWQLIGICETTLEQIADFRLTLSTRYGYPAPPRPQVSAWLTPVRDEDELMRALAAWRGEHAGVHLTYQAPEIRGGRWRRLLDAGFTLRLNTAAQAAEVVSVVSPATAAA